MAFSARKIWLLLVMAALPASSFAAEPSAVASVLSGDTFALNDGRTVKLDGIAAPFSTTADLAEQSRAALEKLTAGKTPELEDSSTDRYGCLAAQVFVPKAKGRVRLQEEMLRDGMAFVYPPTGSEPDLDVLFKAENDARKAGRGIWADKAYADTPDTKAAAKTGRFTFVSGKILQAERVKDKVYLRFGDDWRKDFTISIAAHYLAAFRKAGVDPLAYEGKSIRVRGWMERDGGRVIEVTAPGQIEITPSP